MIQLKIPIEQNIKILIGEVWVKVDIKFTPVVPLKDTLENITIEQLNSRLSKVAYQLSDDIEKQIKEILNHV